MVGVPAGNTIVCSVKQNECTHPNEVCNIEPLILNISLNIELNFWRTWYSCALGNKLLVNIEPQRSYSPVALITVKSVIIVFSLVAICIFGDWKFVQAQPIARGRTEPGLLCASNRSWLRCKESVCHHTLMATRFLKKMIRFSESLLEIVTIF